LGAEREKREEMDRNESYSTKFQAIKTTLKNTENSFHPPSDNP
jgi:hypothetical protein